MQPMVATHAVNQLGPDFFWTPDGPLPQGPETIEVVPALRRCASSPQKLGDHRIPHLRWVRLTDYIIIYIYIYIHTYSKRTLVTVCNSARECWVRTTDPNWDAESTVRHCCIVLKPQACDNLNQWYNVYSSSLGCGWPGWCSPIQPKSNLEAPPCDPTLRPLIVWRNASKYI